MGKLKFFYCLIKAFCKSAVKMTCLRPFSVDDLFRFNNVNLDPLTETYGLSFYLQYLARWPQYFTVAENPAGELMGYIMGKAEGSGGLDRPPNAQGLPWHGHGTALTVAPEFRRLGLAGNLMGILEEASEAQECYFIDLFVRVSNEVAVSMYKKFGYEVYRTVLDYYSSGQDSEEDAYDIRKALSRDKKKRSMIPLKDPIRPDDLE